MAAAAISNGAQRPTFSKLLTHSSGFGILSLLVRIENSLNRDLSSSRYRHCSEAGNVRHALRSTMDN